MNCIDSNSESDTSDAPVYQTNIEKCLNYELDTRTENVNSNLEFSLCISFITHLKTLIEIYKKISKTIDIYITDDGVIFSCTNNPIERNINIKSCFYKNSFIDFYTSSPFIHFSIPITAFLSKLKKIKRNFYFRIHKNKGDENVIVSNIPIFQIKINKLCLNETENYFPLSGILFDYKDDKNDIVIKNEIKCLKYSLIENNLGEYQDEKKYFECRSRIGNDSYCFDINSNFFCKIISFFNKEKLNCITFNITKYRNETENCFILKIKGNSSNCSLNIDSKEFYLYSYNDLLLNKNNFKEESQENFNFALNDLNLFIKIKNLNQETNSMIKLFFYDKNIFIQSLVNNLGVMMININ